MFGAVGSRVRVRSWPETDFSWGTTEYQSLRFLSGLSWRPGWKSGREKGIGETESIDPGTFSFVVKLMRRRGRGTSTFRLSEG